MKASEANLLGFLKAPKQFIVPIYQRTYSWTEEQCQQLWDDILKAGTTGHIKAHFVGSVVYIQDSQYQVMSVPQLLVIDGQQRLTTITLLLTALSRAVKNGSTELNVSEQEKITAKKLDNYYLLNSEEEGELAYKLILTQADKDSLLRIVEWRKLPEDYSKRVVENFDFFVDKLEQANLVDVYKGLQKLMIVDISLDREHDNPQLIFESLNSTGLELSQADLIRNYILMGLKPDHQAKIYKDFWFPMEKLFGHSEYSKYFDRFMRDYLTVKLGRIPNINQVYQEFKDFSLSGSFGSVDALVQNIASYSEYFVRMALEQEPDPLLKKQFQSINQLKVDVAYPLLLEAYSDYSLGRLGYDDFRQLIELLESYVFRRAICGIPTNSMNKTFATLYKEIDPNDYLNSFKAILFLKDSYRRFPTDSEFKNALQGKDVYNFRSKNYLLTKLENFNRKKEPVNIGEYTIEHVLPQNEKLKPEWVTSLGDNWKSIQDKYLHTLGNLTLTGYNPELSDRPFLEKRDMAGGFKTSPLNLNLSLGNLDSWNEQEIINRANQLSDLSIQTWSFPKIDDDVIAKYKELKSEPRVESEWTIEDHHHLTGDMLALYEEFRQRVLAISPLVTEECKKYYIAFKTHSSFVDVIAQKSRLKLVLNIDFSEINDPQGICWDATGKGMWGNGDVVVGLYKKEELDYIMTLVTQAYEASQAN
ncbi:DUF262 domain-containing protein [Polynucleobacter sp. MWH-Mekk-B1]|uniref:DUF262 and DUF1524 domain-containing protein n=1 Tax=Polynucleobacter finlandensis TaxID=1855894 RepID=UPI001C0D08D6|nr:DUF262 and DUF1524 domain-containing protein [Polynucleobacter finlandensis]MBU3545463.1 DUF262 domain-containing protein [Polynucleobacter finlandensis]